MINFNSYYDKIKIIYKYFNFIIIRIKINHNILYILFYILNKIIKLTKLDKYTLII